ncbi:DUF4124 domain-containing protein [Marinimicrobium sp. C2-29]|uniref:DUF4124 domain-containing protein n=1 Tax=Marinimicrobium sp. C2-29 TaxID=3139825 RepID=UPI003139C019
MKSVLLCSLAVAGVLMSTLAGADTVYKWVDDEGVTHFSAHPPKNRQSDQMRTRTGHSEPVDYSQRFKAEEEQSDTSNEATANREGRSQQELDEACEAARENLAMIEGGRRIAVTDENGERRYLNQDEIDERAEQARQVRDRAC